MNKTHIWRWQSSFDIERVSFVEKLKAIFVELFLLFSQHISWMDTYEKLIRYCEIVMLYA